MTNSFVTIMENLDALLLHWLFLQGDDPRDRSILARWKLEYLLGILWYYKYYLMGCPTVLYASLAAMRKAFHAKRTPPWRRRSTRSPDLPQIHGIKSARGVRPDCEPKPSESFFKGLLDNLNKIRHLLKSQWLLSIFKTAPSRLPITDKIHDGKQVSKNDGYRLDVCKGKRLQALSTREKLVARCGKDCTITTRSEVAFSTQTASDYALKADSVESQAGDTEQLSVQSPPVTERPNSRSGGGDQADISTRNVNRPTIVIDNFNEIMCLEATDDMLAFDQYITTKSSAVGGPDIPQSKEDDRVEKAAGDIDQKDRQELPVKNSRDNQLLQLTAHERNPKGSIHLKHHGTRQELLLRASLVRSNSIIMVDEAATDLLSGDFNSICRRYTKDKRSETTVTENSLKCLRITEGGDSACHEFSQTDTAGQHAEQGAEPFSSQGMKSNSKLSLSYSCQLCYGETKPAKEAEKGKMTQQTHYLKTGKAAKTLSLLSRETSSLLWAMSPKLPPISEYRSHVKKLDPLSVKTSQNLEKTSQKYPRISRCKRETKETNLEQNKLRGEKRKIEDVEKTGGFSMPLHGRKHNVNSLHTRAPVTAHKLYSSSSTSPLRCNSTKLSQQVEGDDSHSHDDSEFWLRPRLPSHVATGRNKVHTDRGTCKAIGMPHPLKRKVNGKEEEAAGAKHELKPPQRKMVAPLAVTAGTCDSRQNFQLYHRGGQVLQRKSDTAKDKSKIQERLSEIPKTRFQRDSQNDLQKFPASSVSIQSTEASSSSRLRGIKSKPPTTIANLSKAKPTRGRINSKDEPALFDSSVVNQMIQMMKELQPHSNDRSHLAGSVSGRNKEGRPEYGNVCSDRNPPSKEINAARREGLEVNELNQRKNADLYTRNLPLTSYSRQKRPYVSLFTGSSLVQREQNSRIGNVFKATSSDHTVQVAKNKNSQTYLHKPEYNDKYSPLQTDFALSRQEDTSRVIQKGRIHSHQQNPTDNDKFTCDIKRGPSHEEHRSELMSKLGSQVSDELEKTMCQAECRVHNANLLSNQKPSQQMHDFCKKNADDSSRRPSIKYPTPLPRVAQTIKTKHTDQSNAVKYFSLTNPGERTMSLAKRGSQFTLIARQLPPTETDDPQERRQRNSHENVYSKPFATNVDLQEAKSRAGGREGDSCLPRDSVSQFCGQEKIFDISITSPCDIIMTDDSSANVGSYRNGSSEAAAIKVTVRGDSNATDRKDSKECLTLRYGIKHDSQQQHKRALRSRIPVAHKTVMQAKKNVPNTTGSEQTFQDQHDHSHIPNFHSTYNRSEIPCQDQLDVTNSTAKRRRKNTPEGSYVKENRCRSTEKRPQQEQTNTRLQQKEELRLPRRIRQMSEVNLKTFRNSAEKDTSPQLVPKRGCSFPSESISSPVPLFHYPNAEPVVMIHPQKLTHLNVFVQEKHDGPKYPLPASAIYKSLNRKPSIFLSKDTSTFPEKQNALKKLQTKSNQGHLSKYNPKTIISVVADDVTKLSIDEECYSTNRRRDQRISLEGAEDDRKTQLADVRPMQADSHNWPNQKTCGKVSHTETDNALMRKTIESVEERNTTPSHMSASIVSSPQAENNQNKLKVTDIRPNCLQSRTRLTATNDRARLYHPNTTYQYRKSTRQPTEGITVSPVNRERHDSPSEAKKNCDGIQREKRSGFEYTNTESETTAPKSLRRFKPNFRVAQKIARKDGHGVTDSRKKRPKREAFQQILANIKANSKHRKNLYTSTIDNEMDIQVKQDADLHNMTVATKNSPANSPGTDPDKEQFKNGSTHGITETDLRKEVALCGKTNFSNLKKHKSHDPQTSPISDEQRACQDNSRYTFLRRHLKEALQKGPQISSRPKVHGQNDLQTRGEEIKETGQRRMNHEGQGMRSKDRFGCSKDRFGQQHHIDKNSSKLQLERVHQSRSISPTESLGKSPDSKEKGSIHQLCNIVLGTMVSPCSPTVGPTVGPTEQSPIRQSLRHHLKIIQKTLPGQKCDINTKGLKSDGKFNPKRRNTLRNRCVKSHGYPSFVSPLPLYQCVDKSGQGRTTFAKKEKEQNSDFFPLAAAKDKDKVTNKQIETKPTSPLARHTTREGLPMIRRLRIGMKTANATVVQTAVDVSPEGKKYPSQTKLLAFPEKKANYFPQTTSGNETKVADTDGQLLQEKDLTNTSAAQREKYHIHSLKSPSSLKSVSIKISPLWGTEPKGGKIRGKRIDERGHPKTANKYNPLLIKNCRRADTKQGNTSAASLVKISKRIQNAGSEVVRHCNSQKQKSIRHEIKKPGSADVDTCHKAMTVTNSCVIVGKEKPRRFKAFSSTSTISPDTVKDPRTPQTKPLRKYGKIVSSTDVSNTVENPVSNFSKLSKYSVNAGSPHLASDLDSPVEKTFEGISGVTDSLAACRSGHKQSSQYGCKKGRQMRALENIQEKSLEKDVKQHQKMSERNVTNISEFEAKLLDEEDCRLPDKLPEMIRGSSDECVSSRVLLNREELISSKTCDDVCPSKSTDSGKTDPHVAFPGRAMTGINIDELRKKYLQEMSLRRSQRSTFSGANCSENLGKLHTREPSTGLNDNVNLAVRQHGLIANTVVHSDLGDEVSHRPCPAFTSYPAVSDKTQKDSFGLASSKTDVGQSKAENLRKRRMNSTNQRPRIPEGSTKKSGSSGRKVNKGPQARQTISSHNEAKEGLGTGHKSVPVLHPNQDQKVTIRRTRLLPGVGQNRTHTFSTFKDICEKSKKDGNGDSDQPRTHSDCVTYSQKTPDLNHAPSPSAPPCYLETSHGNETSPLSTPMDENPLKKNDKKIHEISPIPQKSLTLYNKKVHSTHTIFKNHPGSDSRILKKISKNSVGRERAEETYPDVPIDTDYPRSDTRCQGPGLVGSEGKAQSSTVQNSAVTRFNRPAHSHGGTDADSEYRHAKTSDEAHRATQVSVTRLHERNQEASEKFSKLKKDTNSSSADSSADFVISWVDNSNIQPSEMQHDLCRSVFPHDDASHETQPQESSIDLKTNLASPSNLPVLPGLGRLTPDVASTDDKTGAESEPCAAARGMNSSNDESAAGSSINQSRNNSPAPTNCPVEIHINNLVASEKETTEDYESSSHSPQSKLPFQFPKLKSNTKSNPKRILTSVVYSLGSNKKQRQSKTEVVGVPSCSGRSSDGGKDGNINQTKKTKMTETNRGQKGLFKRDDTQSKDANPVDPNLGSVHVSRRPSKNRKYVTSALLYTKKKLHAASPDKSQNAVNRSAEGKGDPALGVNNSASIGIADIYRHRNAFTEKTSSTASCESDTSSDEDDERLVTEQSCSPKVRKVDLRALSNHIPYAQRIANNQRAKSQPLAQYKSFKKFMSKAHAKKRKYSSKRDSPASSFSILVSHPFSASSISTDDSESREENMRAVTRIKQRYHKHFRRQMCRQSADENEEGSTDHEEERGERAHGATAQGSEHGENAKAETRKVTKVNFDWYKPSVSSNVLARRHINQQRQQGENSDMERSEQAASQSVAQNSQTDRATAANRFRQRNGQPDLLFVSETHEGQMPSALSSALFSHPTFPNSYRGGAHPHGAQCAATTFDPHSSSQIPLTVEPDLYSLRGSTVSRSQAPMLYNTNGRAEIFSTTRPGHLSNTMAPEDHTNGSANIYEQSGTLTRRHRRPPYPFVQAPIEDISVSHLNTLYQNLQRNYSRANEVFHSNWILANQNNSLNTHRPNLDPRACVRNSGGHDGCLYEARPPCGSSLLSQNRDMEMADNFVVGSNRALPVLQQGPQMQDVHHQQAPALSEQRMPFDDHQVLNHAAREVMPDNAAMQHGARERRQNFIINQPLSQGSQTVTQYNMSLNTPIFRHIPTPTNGTYQSSRLGTLPWQNQVPMTSNSNGTTSYPFPGQNVFRRPLSQVSFSPDIPVRTPDVQPRGVPTSQLSFDVAASALVRQPETNNMVDHLDRMFDQSHP